VEHGAELTDGRTSILSRALEYFILSIPFGCRFNLGTYGFSGAQLFPKPLEMTAANRAEALKLSNNPRSETPGRPFSAAHQSILTAVDPQIESIVIVIGSSVTDELSTRHTYFFLDPFSRGDLREDAAEKQAIYLPVASESHLFSAILSVIKLTAAQPFTSVALTVGDRSFPIARTMPGLTFSALVAVDAPDFPQITLNCEAVSLEIPVFASSLPVLHHLWAFEKIKASSPEEAAQLAIAAQILTADTSSIIAIARDEELEGDVTHVDSRLTGIGIGWVSPQSPDPGPAPAPAPGPQPVLPMPLPMPMPPHILPFPYRPMPRPHPMPRPMPARWGVASAAGRPGVLDSSADVVDETRAKMIPVPQENMFVRRMPAKPNESARFQAAPAPERAAAPLKDGRRPFFLLRILQLQDVDGSWVNEKSLTSCCGFAIPAQSAGLDRRLFLTAFIIGCLRLKAKDDEDKWELVVEKAITFLRRERADFNWDEQIEAIQRELTA
jgi:hypothetical protein